MKKIAAIVLTFFMLLAFASCGGNVSDVPETTTQSVETITHTAVESVNLEANDEDFDNLINVVRGIWLSSPKNISEDLTDGKNYFYDRFADTALADAMYMIHNQEVPFLYLADSMYDLNIECEGFWSYDRITEEPLTIPADPMNAFGDSEYIKINADAVDWILEKVLGVAPDRTKTDDDFDTSEYYGVFNYYYCDGYYYYEVEEGGGGGHYPTIVDYAEQEDGSYIVKLSTHEEDYEYETEYEIFEASAALREVDGKRVWSVSYLKVIDIVYAKN